MTGETGAFGERPRMEPVQDALAAENAALRARIEQLEAELARLRMGAVPPTVPPPPLPPTTTPPTTPMMPPAIPGIPTTETAPPLASAPSRGGIESFVGRNIVPFVGAIAVLAGIAVLVGYAIDMGYFGRVPAEIRFMLGILGGVALLGFGEIVRRRGAPGASVGLDAAGVGTLLVTIALGVYMLQLFGPVVGAVLGAGAGMFGAAWAVRSKSIVVGIVALVGLFAVPVGFDIFREATLLAGFLITSALAAALAMHALGGARFRAARIFGILATILLAVVWMNSGIGSLPRSGFAMLWWMLVTGELVLCALRGESRREESVLLVVSSLSLAAAQGVGWWSPSPAKQLESWLPVMAGALLAGAFAFLRSFALAGGVDEVDAAEDTTDARAIDASCRQLSESALAMALTLGGGGLAVFADDAWRGMVFALVALVAALLGGRAERRSLTVVASIQSFVAMATIVFNMIEARGGVTRLGVELLFVPEGGLRIRFGVEIALAILFSVLFLGARALPIGRFEGVVFAVMGGIAWFAVAVTALDSPAAFAAWTLPAIVIALIPRAPLTTVLAGAGLALLGAAGWVVRGSLVAFGEGSSQPYDAPALVAYEGLLPVLALLFLARHPSLRRVGGILTTVSVAYAGLASAIVAMVFAGWNHFGGDELTLVAVIVAASFGAIGAAFGSSTGRPAVRDGAAAVGLLGMLMASFVGMGRIFESGAPAADERLWLAVLACAASAIALGTFARAWNEPDSGSPTVRLAVGSAAAACVAPLGALLLAALFARPMNAAVAAGWIALAAVLEFFLGFRLGHAALRWGALATCVLLVARLYLVDLRETPVLLRIALLIVAGLILVVVGIVYARRAARERGGADAEAPPPLPPPPPPPTAPPSARP